MGVDSGIGWTDNTFNTHWGCEKISPACNNCYAETWAKRTGYPDIWDTGKYRFFGDKHWSEPLKWQRKAEKENRRIKVFCASMADWADIKVPNGDKLRERLFKLIKATPMLDWQLLTKRIGNVESMLPNDWKDGYPNGSDAFSIARFCFSAQGWADEPEYGKSLRWLNLRRACKSPITQLVFYTTPCSFLTSAFLALHRQSL